MVFKKRLKDHGPKYAQDGLVLAETQLVASKNPNVKRRRAEKSGPNIPAILARRAPFTSAVSKAWDDSMPSPVIALSRWV